MKTCRILCAVATIVLLSHAAAAAGEWQVGVRGVSLQTRDSSSSGIGFGSQVAVGSAASAEIDVTYLLPGSWAVELSLASARLELETRGGTIDGWKLGKTRLTPPTIAAQYRFQGPANITPYLGVGVGYALFSPCDMDTATAGTVLHKLEINDAFGIVSQLGVDIELSEGWHVNLDAKYLRLGTDLRATNSAGVEIAVIRVDFNPWIIGIGAAYRF